ncbi:hydantoinase B/oxoprolinase family protein, partial [Escherichia coli]|uniref:hydantoinase B/oxoprolinase family protein n=1 Tax=Escherichia coli TaxID=562 RepID=UPI0013D65F9C
VAHHLDVGGGAPGMNTSATDYFQEGLIIPPSKYNLQSDWLDDGPLQRFLAANFRVPDMTIGDIDSQFAACAVGVDRVKELVAKFGVATVK